MLVVAIFLMGRHCYISKQTETQKNAGCTKVYKPNYKRGESTIYIVQ